MRWVVLFVLFSACGGRAPETQSPEPPSNTVADPPAVADSGEVEDIEPGVPDREELCALAMDRTIAMLGMTDQNEILQTRAHGIRDCLSSEATREDLACIIEARDLGQVAHCHDRSR